MNMRTNKMKMRGFMCQSEAATAVCMGGGDTRRSVIVPRRLGKSDHSSCLITSNANNYSRLVDSSTSLGLIAPPSLRANKQRPVISPTQKIDQHPHHNPKSLHKPSSPSEQVCFQVVEMRVSIHCQGCAGKVKKHLSKMEGVTTFSIDVETKRVTVMGHVSPVAVLESISKVKKAEFWSC